jgi:pimeloyl-ACP methyl ester carboxylesterase
MIFVSAAGSGNDASVVGRRVPLALIGYANIARRFPIDPARVYVGGFSGGSRVALRIALAYPDIFRGALLNAGSDAIGVSPIHLPSPELMSLFRARSRIVEVTGSDDPGSLALDLASQQSFRKWCVPGVQAKVTPWAAHGPADGAAFSWALAALTGPAPAADAALAACRAARTREVAEALRKAGALVDAGRGEAARRELLGIDNSLGGLAAPASVGLADRCRCGIFQP